MLYLNEDELKDRLPEVIHKTIHANQGKTVGSPNLTEEMRVAVGTLAKVAGPSIAAEVLNVTQTQASNLSRAHRTTGSGVDPILKDKIDERLGVIRNMALEKLLAGMESIDEDKLRESKPRDLAAFSKDMSAVYKNTGEQGNTINAGQVIIYTPKQNTIDDYEAPIDITPVKQ